MVRRVSLKESSNIKQVAAILQGARHGESEATSSARRTKSDVPSTNSGLDTSQPSVNPWETVAPPPKQGHWIQKALVACILVPLEVGSSSPNPGCAKNQTKLSFNTWLIGS